MEDRLEKELTEKYKGKKVKEECTEYYDLEDEYLMEKDLLADEEDEEDCEEQYDSGLSISMCIQVEIDDDNCITEVCIGFRTWGDDGIGDADPEYYWEYDECFDAAEKFFQNILDGKDEKSNGTDCVI